MATFQQLTDATIGVSAHAWSPDGNEIAFAPNSNELRIAVIQARDLPVMDKALFGGGDKPLAPRMDSIIFLACRDLGLYARSRDGG